MNLISHLSMVVRIQPSMTDGSCMPTSIHELPFALTGDGGRLKSRNGLDAVGTSELQEQATAERSVMKPSTH